MGSDNISQGRDVPGEMLWEKTCDQVAGHWMSLLPTRR